MAQDSAKDLTFCSQNSLKSSILENIMGYVDYGSPLLVKDKGTDSNEDTNIIFSCSFVINSRLTKTEDLSFVRQLFSALSISAWGFHKFGYCDTPVVMTKLIVAYFNFQNSHSQAWLLHFFTDKESIFFRNIDAAEVLFDELFFLKVCRALQQHSVTNNICMFCPCALLCVCLHGCRLPLRLYGISK